MKLIQNKNNATLLCCHYVLNFEKLHIYLTQSSLNKRTAQILVTAKSVVDSAEQFEFRPIRSSKVQINQPVAFKIQIVQLNLIYILTEICALLLFGLLDLPNSL